MVFDCSARPSPTSNNINECMYTGPALQPNLWDIVVRARMALNILTGDLQKAFLQIGLKTCDREAYRFLFNINGREEHFCFSRLPFGQRPVHLFLVRHCFIIMTSNQTVMKKHLNLSKRTLMLIISCNLVVISKSLTRLRLKQQKFWNRGGSQFTSGNQTSVCIRK